MDPHYGGSPRLDAAKARRLLARAEIYDGGSRSDAARIGGVTLQIVRDGSFGSTPVGRTVITGQGAW
jgi:hypothetical protein